MVSRRIALLACLMLPAIAVPLCAAVPLQAAPPKTVVVVVTQKNSALTTLSLVELKHMYMSEPVTDPAGTPLVPLNHPAGVPIRVGFDKLVLKMSPEHVGRFWIDRKIRGQTGAPKAVPSVEVLRRAVAALAGAVSYLAVADVTPDLKVVIIDGKRPTDPDYPLQFE